MFRSRCSSHFMCLLPHPSSLLQGAGVLPLWSYYLISGTWLHGDDVCRWWLAADIMATCASALAIIFMACDRLVSLVD